MLNQEYKNLPGAIAQQTLRCILIWNKALVSKVVDKYGKVKTYGKCKNVEIWKCGNGFQTVVLSSHTRCLRDFRANFTLDIS